MQADRVRRLFILLLVCVVLSTTVVACAPKPGPLSAPEPLEPYWPTEAWRTCAPEQQGLDSARLAKMLEEMAKEGDAIDSVLVVRNGYLVLDAVVAPYQRGKAHIIHSCTKSVVSTLIGIAIASDEMEGIDQPLLEIFPDKQAANLDARKEAITLEDMLMMAGGLDCQDSWLYRWEGLRQMRGTDDWVQFMLDLPMVAEPGSKFEYCNGGSFLLSAIVQEATGQSAEDYARERLFGPLGMADWMWPQNPQGISIGWGELHLRPHDMARFGYLFLNEGQWDGAQIVPVEWVAAATQPRIRGNLQPEYGYQWWINEDVYMALGYAGQYIIVAPELDLVVVFVSHLGENDFYRPWELYEEHIVPAVRSEEALRANPRAERQLERALEALAE